MDLKTQTSGKRKSSIARVVLTKGSGNITINKKAYNEYLDSEIHQKIITIPLNITETSNTYDISVNVQGGGKSGQAGAIKHAISKALILVNPELRKKLKENGLLTRDSRVKERRKYGLKKARKAPQFSKR